MLGGYALRLCPEAIGVPKMAIARKMGCSRHTVYAVLDRIGKYGDSEYL